MVGKATFFDGLHPSNEGAICGSVEIGAGEWRQLECALGNLSPRERQNIVDFCDFLSIAKDCKPTPSRDQLATLDKIAGMRQPDEIMAAYRDCDASSRGLIDTAIYQLAGRSFFDGSMAMQRKAMNIRAAAWLAGQDFTSRPGRIEQGWQQLAAEYAVQLCEARGVMRIPHAFDEDLVQPVVSVLQALLGIVAPISGAQSVSRCVKLIRSISARSA